MDSGAGSEEEAVVVGLWEETGGERCEDWRVDVEATETSEGGLSAALGA